LIYKYHKNDLDFRKATISRIDIACNLPFFLNSNSFKIKTEAQNPLKYFQWYIGNQKKINLNGIQIGKRGSKGYNYLFTIKDTLQINMMTIDSNKKLYQVEYE
jgi:hypothetical protein